MKLMLNTKYQILNTGFTLVELLVVLAIIGVLATLITGGFINSQIKGRDAQRKSDLKQIANALELYYNDYGVYPDAPLPAWGSGSLTDGKTTYMKKMPIDPSSNQNYYYRLVDATSKKFQLFARLENTQDSSIITTTYSCGSAGNCNFAVTSPNTTPSE